MKAARAVVTTTPGLAEALRRDWRKAPRFYARFGISEEQFRHGVSAWTGVSEGETEGPESQD